MKTLGWTPLEERFENVVQSIAKRFPPTKTTKAEVDSKQHSPPSTLFSRSIHSSRKRKMIQNEELEEEEEIYLSKQQIMTGIKERQFILSPAKKFKSSSTPKSKGDNLETKEIDQPTPRKQKKPAASPVSNYLKRTPKRSQGKRISHRIKKYSPFNFKK